MKKKNMQDVPIKYYQALRRDVDGLKSEVRALHKLCAKLAKGIKINLVLKERK
jgi:hypothetical protein